MQQPKLLIANRGEIAIRIAKAAYELDFQTVSIYSEDDANCLHIRKTDEAIPLKGKGVAAYLDMNQIIEIAEKAGCNLIHPGYGFLSEHAEFAEKCEEKNIKFVGPNSKILDLLGDKIKARQLAQKLSIPTILGTSSATTFEAAKAFFEKLEIGESLMIKAISGGGGRGMRIVNAIGNLKSDFERCQSEALKAFGNSRVYVEKYLPKARHVEVQILGDGKEVIHLFERECSIQRKNQKLIEIAPCPDISKGLRARIISAALTLAKAVNYESAGTFEFLVEGIELNENANFYFIEANPRIQVEHTISEEITGVDIVQFQLQQAVGQTLQDLDLVQEEIKISGAALQIRINTESIDNQLNTKVNLGKISSFEMPFGKGVRVDTLCYLGYQNSPNFDTLLAKLICHSSSNNFQQLIKKSYRALCEFKLEGIETNLAFLQNILQHTDFQSNQFYTRFIEKNITDLLPKEEGQHERFYFENSDKNTEIEKPKFEENIPEGTTAIFAPMSGTIVKIELKKGDKISIGQDLLIVEAMKMENVLKSEISGIVQEIKIQEGEVIFEKQPLFFISKFEEKDAESVVSIEIDLTKIRPELADLQKRKAYLLDENRPEKIAKRYKKGKQTARENIAQLCDEDSFVEYGSLVVAAQRSRRSIEDLMKNTPADGVICGIGNINSEEFGEETKCSLMIYDYTVLAGTQGMFGHQKSDRFLKLAHQSKLPFILFAEGGGGRPGDTDFQGIGGLHVPTFALFAKLSGIVPRITVVSGYCFAGNAALAGCSDIIIATEDTSIGMGGPAMIEGGGLGVYHPKQVGPIDIQAPNGVLDIIVKDEKEAVEMTKKVLSYFQGKTENWECADQRVLRHLIPENRRRVYDIYKVIEALADKDSVTELRKDFAKGMITAFIRIEGKPMGLLANNPKYLGGALDAEGSGKAARFIQLCDTFDIPILSLCDTPGFMVGPEAEKTALVRHTSRLFTAGAKADIPIFTVVLRKAYGLGSMAMAAGGFHEAFFTVSWPTGEFGGMGLEGAVRLGFKKELEKIENLEEREAAFQKMVDKMYQHGKAMNAAAFLEIDDVIDPVDTRKWVLNGLLATGNLERKSGKRFVDTW